MFQVPKRKRPFEVLVEAKLTVDAFDAESAQRKAERSLPRGRRLDPDVVASGDVWSYEAVPLDDTGAARDVAPAEARR